ncbi:hypothetical protein [Chitinophaga sp. MD30]|uniref:hypothetical protein n=1 Tax=Chitinophaga sp. MD30 TaxID=2033437 RepID=UPI000BB0BBDA|nr:hypothetical protein [Chitinophaga sp. MD30]ASZ13221.1 hypothetical protein CK934_20775 [Chitinophaga sp. MD30]
MNPTNGHSLWKDDRRRVRVLNHLHHPVSFKVRSETPQLLAQAYIMEIAGLYEIRPAQLYGLPFSASNRLVVEQASFRFEREEIKDNNVIITYAQTYFGVPVWAAGLEVNMHTNPLQVISSSSTAYANLSVQLPSPAAASRVYHYSNADLQHAVQPPEARERDEGGEGDIGYIGHACASTAIAKADASPAMPPLPWPPSGNSGSLPYRLTYNPDGSTSYRK